MMKVVQDVDGLILEKTNCNDDHFGDGRAPSMKM